MFGLTDRAILSELAMKIKNKIPTTVYYDIYGSTKAYPYLKGGNIHPLQGPGLTHQKILVLDQKMIFIGSANMTPSSLNMHDNLIIGFISPKVARFLENHRPYFPGHIQTIVGGQKIDLWLLPDPRGHALSELRKQIRSAKKSIRIALFTFTHPTLVDEVIHAHQRGVDVRLVIDMKSGFGASAKIVRKLYDAKVPIWLSQGPQLMHHKFVYIDEKTLITGSANWTKAAFYKNSDCILALHLLKTDQKRFLNKLWTQIESATQKKSW